MSFRMAINDHCCCRQLASGGDRMRLNVAAVVAVAGGDGTLGRRGDEMDGADGIRKGKVAAGFHPLDGRPMDVETLQHLRLIPGKD